MSDYFQQEISNSNRKAKEEAKLEAHRLAMSITRNTSAKVVVMEG